MGTWGRREREHMHFLPQTRLVAYSHEATTNGSPPQLSSLRALLSDEQTIWDSLGLSGYARASWL